MKLQIYSYKKIRNMRHLDMMLVVTIIKTPENLVKYKVYSEDVNYKMKINIKQLFY